MKARGPARRARRGAVLLEYAIMTCMLLGVLTMTAVLLVALKEHGVRVLNLLASEYP